MNEYELGKKCKDRLCEWAKKKKDGMAGKKRMDGWAGIEEEGKGSPRRARLYSFIPSI